MPPPAGAICGGGGGDTSSGWGGAQSAPPPLSGCPAARPSGGGVRRPGGPLLRVPLTQSASASGGQRPTRGSRVRRAEVRRGSRPMPPPRGVHIGRARLFGTQRNRRGTRARARAQTRDWGAAGGRGAVPPPRTHTDRRTGRFGQPRAVTAASPTAPPLRRGRHHRPRRADRPPRRARTAPPCTGDGGKKNGLAHGDIFDGARGSSHASAPPSLLPHAGSGRGHDVSQGGGRRHAGGEIGAVGGDGHHAQGAGEERRRRKHPLARRLRTAPTGRREHQRPAGREGTQRGGDRARAAARPVEDCSERLGCSRARPDRVRARVLVLPRGS